MSLEDHISSRVYPARLRNNRLQPKPYTRANRSRVNNGEGMWRHDRYEGAAFSKHNNSAFPTSSNDLDQPMNLLKVENLHWNVSVTEEDIRNLFNAVGEVEKVKIQFDNAGRSEGIAFVTFVHPQEAADALEQYQKVLLDDMPMQLTLLPNRRANKDKSNIGHESRNASDKILKRLGPVNVLKRLGDKPVTNRLGPRVRNVKIGGEYGSRGALRNSQGKRNDHDSRRENVSKEDLDQDMDFFMSGVSTTLGEGTGRPVLSYADDVGPPQGQ
ncbi:hypothetical protein HK096_006663 [Nowakowskiella sp. JEL0078]|nr:hypothetical protein HK096_006663 [Nowakowskiella sp. JEL0078]